jgi:H(+)-transporting ATP synthase subunit D
MAAAAVRARLLARRRERAAARYGRTLLEQKHEAIHREITSARLLLAERRRQLREALRTAARLLEDALVESGRVALDAAAGAQPGIPDVAIVVEPLAGVAVPRLRLPPVPLRPCFGPCGAPESADIATAAWVRLLPAIVALAEADAGLDCLRAAAVKTARRLNALDKAVLPRLDREIADIETAIEEEERDEFVRRRRFLAAGEIRHD